MDLLLILLSLVFFSLLICLLLISFALSSLLIFYLYVRQLDHVAGADDDDEDPLSCHPRHGLRQGGSEVVHGGYLSCSQDCHS